MWPFYVYELIDPRDGSVFYVGKGKRDRIHAHEREAQKGEASEKCDRIRAIWQDGFRVEKREVARFKDASAAYEYEAQRIQQYTGLTNVVLHDAKAKVRHWALSPEFLRIVAWWLKETKGGSRVCRYESETHPFAAAVMSAASRRGKEFYARALNAAGSFDEFAKRIKPFGVEFV